MSDYDFEKLGLEAWLYISCSDKSGELFHSSEFGKTSDGTWYWANPSRQEDGNSPQITLWSKNYVESRDAWIFRGAFHSTIRSDIYSEENLIDCFRDFLICGWPDRSYFGLHTKLAKERLKFEDHVFEGFGSDLDWDFKWSSIENRDFGEDDNEFHQSQLFDKQEIDFQEDWD